METITTSKADSVVTVAICPYGDRDLLTPTQITKVSGPSTKLLQVPLGTHVPDGWLTVFASPSASYCTDLTRVHVSERERNPFDTPPGIGYKALKKANAYLKPKTLTHGFAVVTNGYQFKEYTPNPNRYWYSCVCDVLNNSPVNTFRIADDAELSRMRTEAFDLAVKNLYASLGKRTKINGGVMLAELHESMSLLGKACTTLLLIVQAVKRGRISEAIELISKYGGGRIPTRIVSREQENRNRRRRGDKPITKSEYSSSTWLELQFGWLPIVNDIYSIIEFIEEAADTSVKHGPWFSFSGYGKSKAEGTIYTGTSNFATWWNTSAQGTHEMKIAVTATFRLQSPFKDMLNSIGLANPASIIWETVPFSFVIDWFIPVGAWIESFTAHAGLEILDIHYSVKDTVDIKWSNPHQKYPYDPVSFDDVTAHSQYFVRVIDPDSSELPPFPQVNATLKSLISPWKLTTSLALFRQVRGK